ncbi:MAG: Clp protease ClpP [Desulfobulbaceae bacterium]|nr:Clp protease ClpP [Desulfobulbaceae bacterium]
MLIANNRRTDRTAAQVAEFWGKSLNDREWFDIKASGKDSAELLIYDVIGWPFVEASELVRALQGLQGADLTVRINSPGGDVFDGLAIANAFGRHDGHVVTVVDGLAASIASIIHQAGAERIIAANGHIMIHNAWTIAWGDHREMAKASDMLARVSGQLAKTYADRTGLALAKLAKMMDEETWFIGGDEAVAEGFADSVGPAASARAKFDTSIFANAPASLVSLLDTAGGDPTKRKAEHALRQAGLKQHEAKAVLAGGWAAIDQRDVDAAEVLASVRKLTNQLRS